MTAARRAALGGAGVLLAFSPAIRGPAPRVTIDSGAVVGATDGRVVSFKGIPYAKAERFMAPTKPDSWTDVRSSMTYGPVCPIEPTTTVNDEIEFPFHHDWGYTNENCLSLNVWTPQLTNAKKRPVMVWFHGGGFSAGSAGSSLIVG